MERIYQSVAVFLFVTTGLVRSDFLSQGFLSPEIKIHSRSAQEVQSSHENSSQAESELQAGIALTRSAHFAEAIPHFLAARGHVTNEYAAEFNLALCFVGTGQFAKAIPVLIALRDQGRDGAGVENLLAQAYIGNSQSQEGFDALQKAVGFTPRDEKLYLYVADAYTGQQDYTISLRVIDLGLRNLPNSPRLHYERGYLLSLLDEFDLAKSDFDLANQLAPRSDIGYLALAQKNLFAGNLSGTIQVSRAALREGHEDYQLLTILAQALIRSGASPGQPEFVEAREALEKSVAMRPNYASSQVALGNICLMENQFDNAIKHLQVARQLTPRDASIPSLLAAAYRKSGHLQEAEAMLAILAQINQEQAEKISSAPGDRKAIPGASGMERPDRKPTTPP